MKPVRPLPDDLRGLRVVVVGLAKSGWAALELCLARGAKVTAVDQRTEAELAGTDALRVRGVQLALGESAHNALQGVDAVVVSPGVPLALPELVAAREAGIPVVGEIELALHDLRGRGGPRLGITGTNGKSTTTALTGALFAQQLPRVFVGGNLGRPLSEAALDPEPYDALVIELSSFQLEGVVTARFNGAALLNLTPDHLDRYPSHEAYGAAKARIFAAQKAPDVAVVNADDPATRALGRQARVPLYGFTLGGGSAGFTGQAMPTPRGFEFDFADRASFSLDNRALRGDHNRQNAMAAALLASLHGISTASIQRGLDLYPGLPHRLEVVRTLDGVEWVNDSKATNVDSTLVALRAFEGGVWLIAGGRGKGAPYAPLVEAGRGRVQGVLTVGEDGPAVAQAFAGQAAVHACGTLEAAVQEARARAKSGEVVLLSPACASYDQFRNFEHRGEAFKKLVEAL